MSIGVVLVPVSGSTDSIRAMAAGLRDLATAVGRIGGQVLDLRTMATWESPAGERFGAAIALLPTALDQVRHRYLAAGAALEEFAGHHARAAEETEQQAVRHRAAHDDVFAIEDEITRAAMDPAGGARLPDLYARQQAAIVRATAAQESFFRAWRAFEAAAEDCRSRLRAAAQDGIVDTGTYDALRSARTWAQSMTTAFGVAGTLPTPLKAFSTAAAGAGASVVLAGDVLLLLGYDEGSWSGVLETAALNAAGRGAATMSKAAGIGAVKGANGRWTGERLRTSERLQRGRGELREDLARKRAALRTPVADRHLYSPRLGGTRAPVIGPHQQLPTRTMRVIQDRVDAKVLGINERWRMAAAGGANAVVLQASSSTIRVATKARATEVGIDSAREWGQGVSHRG
ncbi:MAG: hypothetical protein ABR500_04075 [Dermatophilaceae bacterium]